MSLRQVALAAALTTTLAGCGQAGRMLDVLPSAAPTAEPAPVAAAAVLPAALRNPPPPLVSPEGPYLLDTGDRLRIFVYGQPNLSRLYTVDHSGNIAFPLVGTIRVRGLATTAVERIIAQRLATNYVKDPQVTVDVQQNRPFFILGEVRNAGQYPFVSGMTVEAAVAIAGGYQERASEDRFRITRRAANGVVDVIEVPADFPVQPGDTIYVYERFF